MYAEHPPLAEQPLQVRLQENPEVLPLGVDREVLLEYKARGVEEVDEPPHGRTIV